MAFLKYFVLFATLFFISAQAQPMEQHDLKPDVIVKTIEKIIIDITDFLGKAYKNGEKVIDYISKNGLDHIQVKTMHYAKEILETMEKIIEHRIDNMSGDVNKEGFKLYKCFKDNVKTINPAVLSYLDNSTKCINKDLAKVAVLLKPILQVLEKVDKKVGEEAKGLEHCTPGDATCLLGVALEILNELSSIPADVAGDFWALFKEMTALLPTIGECSRAAAVEWAWSCSNKWA